jgi:hypothetical protein
MIRESKSRVVILSIILLATLTYIPSGYAGDSTTRTEIEALYAKIDQSRIKKDNTLYQSLEMDDYTSKSKEGKIKTREEADTESNSALARVKEVQSFKTKVEDLKEEKNGEVSVLINMSAVLTGSGPDGKEHKIEVQSKARDVWVKTEQGWKIKSHEGGESSFTVDGQTQEGIYKLAEAGIQFTVPEGWSVEKDKNGSTIVSKLEGADFYVVSFGVLPQGGAASTQEGLFEAVRESTLSKAKKDFKEMKVAEPEQLTINGIPVRRQALSGKVKDVDSIGIFYLLSTERPVFIYVQGTLKKSALDNEFDTLITSIKKIE